MPKKVKQTEVYEDVEQHESTEETPEPEVKISKRTGKPLRPMTEKQKENLAKGRVLAVQRRKEMVEGIDLKKRAENIKKAKEDLHNAKIANHKKSYEDAIKDHEIEEVIPEKPKKEKKVIKKVIKYVEESSSDSEEEEEIIVKKKKKNKQKDEDISHQILRQKLKTNLDEVKSNSMQQLMMPSYF
jgi:hypothetical protein